ncbi:TPA: hypothetical protein ACRNCN_002643 [Pseudomonas aeruginosa]|uniref:hypothetical protein n=1 Tax=Pseudomonas aeruginosa TaxID=287 RepID=UPI003E11CA6F|nr:hypothetical protein [Pseudomonas aeruginosa]
MADTRVVDTNVLIVASAADECSLFDENATPVQEKHYRDKVLAWVHAFEKDVERRVVLDWDWHMCTEYTKKLTEQDYGWLVMMRKHDHGQVEWVGIEVDDNGHALLPDELSAAISDLEDRKMVAAVLAAKADKHDCKLVNACDTDWLDCAAALDKAQVDTEHLIEHEWLRPRWASKKARKIKA